MSWGWNALDGQSQDMLGRHTAPSHAPIQTHSSQQNIPRHNHSPSPPFTSSINTQIPQHTNISSLPFAHQGRFCGTHSTYSDSVNVELSSSLSEPRGFRGRALIARRFVDGDLSVGRSSWVHADLPTHDVRCTYVGPLLTIGSNRQRG